MSDETYADAPQAAAMPPKMEQWVDLLTTANMRVTNIANEIHLVCDRLDGPRPEQIERDPTGTKQLDQGGMIHDIQRRMDSLQEALASAEQAMSRLNGLGL